MKSYSQSGDTVLVMAVRPLHRWRDGGKPAYGNQFYITHDNAFGIMGTGGKWIVCPHSASPQLERTITKTGIFDVVFAKRCEAIAALEIVMEEFE